MAYQPLNLELCEPVQITGFPDDSELQFATGINLGISSEAAGISAYIVLLDTPIVTHKAITVIETCLDRRTN